MHPLQIRPLKRPIRAEISFPGDKSIAHRAAILSAITQGKTVIENFPFNEDCLFTLQALRQAGVSIQLEKKLRLVTIEGRGLWGLTRPQQDIFVGESGTSFRLLMGLFAGQHFRVKMKAGSSLCHRPMRRVSEPLRRMGALIKAKRRISGRKIEEYPPVVIRGGQLRAISYKMPVASAQVKSALLLAGLYARGETKVIEPLKTRDHTEQLLKSFKAGVKLKENYIVIEGMRHLSSPGRIYLPGDISSASFFIVLASLIAGSRLKIKQIGLNPSRMGIVRVLRRMGARIQIKRFSGQRTAGEPIGEILVEGSNLRGLTISRHEVPSLIDELPVLMVAACFADGKSRIKGAAELRFKETDRIRSMSQGLRAMGAEINIGGGAERGDILIFGRRALHGARVSSYRDHRSAMSLVVAGLASQGITCIDDIGCIKKSFPDFLTILKSLL